MTHALHHGDCLQVLRTMPDNSIDSIVTDPPYELGFMGKSWDSTGIAYNVEVWAECLRVLRSGGHLLAFGGSRTYHRLAVAIEDAGFQIRDQIMWVYGSGFPKSLNIGKAIDKQAGATPEAKQWDGWGTALKPAHEPIVLARKPLDGTVANNVLVHGTGGINIDGCRVESNENFDGVKGRAIHKLQTQRNDETDEEYADRVPNNPSQQEALEKLKTLGRFPANFIHDGSDEVLELFPDTKGDTWNTTKGARHFNNDGEPTGYETRKQDSSLGSAARFFYCSKASKKDRNEGLDGFEAKRDADRIADNGIGGDNPRNRSNKAKVNHHPTVKPTDLMRYLVRLVTPPNGTVLDPFAGSGSTGKAAVMEGFNFIGIEQSEEYIEIAQARIEHATTNLPDETLF